MLPDVVILTIFLEADVAYVALNPAFEGEVVTESFTLLAFLSETLETFLEPFLTVIVGFLTVIVTFFVIPLAFAEITTLPAFLAVTT